MFDVRCFSLFGGEEMRQRLNSECSREQGI
jgi:hypothetical protein